MYSPTGAVDTSSTDSGWTACSRSGSAIRRWPCGSVAAVVVWQFAGCSMVIFLAGLQSIPREITDAAAVDGAGAFRRFWDVTRPLLAPALTVNLMLSIIGGLRSSSIRSWVLTNGGPGHLDRDALDADLQDAFQFGEFAYSTALALVLTVFVAVVSGAQYAVLRRQEYA